MSVKKINKLRPLVIIVITLLCFVRVNAQNETTIIGRVLDKADKTTIIGGNIIEYDDNNRVVNGTVTNVNGDFVLKMIDPSHVVKVSVIGYKTQTIEKDPTKTLIVELETSDVELGEVTVTAQAKTGGNLTNIDERDRASSSVKVDLMEMQDVGMVSAADALQGKVSGLDIISASGDPGSGSQLVIRGLSSMGNNQPLIVIDGIPQFRVSSDVDLSSADSEDISNLINIALQDIKSIEVLKDAASTAVYGSRGADGVLLIETHKGRMGKVQFDYQYKYSINFQPAAIPMLDGDEYIMLQLEEWHNSRGLFNVPDEIAYDPTHVDFYNYSANTDWISELTKNAKTHDHFFSISGGGQKARYYTSFSFLDEGGTTIGTGYQRFSSRINLDYFLSKQLLFQIKSNFISSNTESNNEINRKNVREMAYIKAPNMSIWEYDAYGNPTGEYFTPISTYQGNGYTYFNPVAIARLGVSDNRLNKLGTTFNLRYRVKDWLILRETISFQAQGVKIKTFIPYNAIGTDWLSSTINQAEERNNFNMAIRTETQLSFDSPFRRDDLKLSGAFTWITDQGNYDNMYERSNQIPSVNIDDLSVDALIGHLSNVSGDSRMLSGLGNINCNYLDRYLIQTIIRADAHSSFGENNRWGVFKGVSLGWRFSNEFFLSSATFLNDSKLIASWGTSGRQPKNVYARFSTYESIGSGSYTNIPTIAPASIHLNNLRWENITTYNAGIELNMFDNRLFLKSEIYKKITNDILFDRYDIPHSSGFNRLFYLNGGEMTNKGWELMFDTKIIRTKEWLWSFYFNTSNNVNSFNRLPENFNSESSTSIGNGEYPRRVIEGEPIGSFFGFRYLGVWANDEDVVAKDVDGNIILDGDDRPFPLRYSDSYIFKGGDPIYEDINHDGRIDLADVVYLGDSNPDFLGGFGSTLKYKSFDVSANFHYRTGFDIINNVAIQTEGMNNRNNQSKAVLNRWRVKGQEEEGLLPRAYMNHPANNLGSDRYVEKGDFVRLNSVKISYQFSKNLCERLGVRKAILTLSARKLFTYTNYTGQDPEVGQNASDPFWIGVDNAKTPPPKIVTLNAAIGF